MPRSVRQTSDFKFACPSKLRDVEVMVAEVSQSMTLVEPPSIAL
jgi:hypothetical protein